MKHQTIKALDIIEKRTHRLVHALNQRSHSGPPYLSRAFGRPTKTVTKFMVLCIEKTKIKKKKPGMADIFKKKLYGPASANIKKILVRRSITMWPI